MTKTTPKETGIMFTAQMVRAILAGKKTQTRRIINPQPTFNEQSGLSWKGGAYGISLDGKPYLNEFIKECRYGVPGDRLWVRETWADVNTEGGPAFFYRADGGMHYCSDDAYPVEYERYPGSKFAMWWSDLHNGAEGHSWRPSILMYRYASRITLELTEVRVERVQDITEADVIAEGCPDAILYGTGWYKNLWIEINGADSWAQNPFVRVLSFRRLMGTDAK